MLSHIAISAVCGAAAAALVTWLVMRARLHAAEALAAHEKELRATLEGLGRRCELITALLQSAEGEDRMAAHKIDDLTAAAADSVTAAQAMDAAIVKVQGGAGETAELSAQVSTEAERGYRAVHRTLDEIERIRTTTSTARERIASLDARAVDIGHVVKVIQEITEKTNLLALNASIIAAQAGEHGRSFAVVATEIKALAQRTAASTKEIGEQIRGVQHESERARGAMDAGVAAVEEGFQVAVSAGDALEAIRQTARAAQKQVQTMTRTLKQQAGVAQQVIDSAAQVAERSASFQQAMRGQSTLFERLRGALLDIQAGALEIAERMRGQSEGSTHAMDAINHVVERLTIIRRRERELRRSIKAVAAQLTDSDGDPAAQWATVEEATARLSASIERLRSERA